MQREFLGVLALAVVAYIIATASNGAMSPRIGPAFPIREVVGVAVAITGALALLRSLTQTSSHEREVRSVAPLASATVLAGLAIAAHGWAAPLGLAGIAVAIVVTSGTAPAPKS